jgi:hypothetical protein
MVGDQAGTATPSLSLGFADYSKLDAELHVISSIER